VAGLRLSRHYAEQVLWPVQAPPLELPPTPLPTSADVVVVGGGYAGMAAAHELADRGQHVAVIEKEAVGWQASTRNGGMVIPELKAGPRALEREYGPVGRRMYAEVNEAFDHVEALVGDDGIDCSYERTGQLYLAHSPRHVPALKAMAREHGTELGEGVWFVPRDELPAEVGSSEFHAGLVLERTGGLQPAAFHRGLVRRALDTGAEVYDHTAALAIEHRPGWPGRRVVTSRGAIDARVVMVFTNAYADGLLPSLQRSVLPVGSFIIATEVLDPQLAEAVSPRRRMLVDTKNFLSYWRLTPDGRMAFGGRRSFAPTSLTEAREFLGDQLVRVHPQLADVKVEYVWGGNVAITYDRLPHVGSIDGAWYATGCNGSGVATNTWMGARLAQAVCGDAPLPAFSELRHPRIPAWRLRNLYLPAVGRWYRHQDTR
jgi:glycine/D-amino acid oxidase-like deaminating enzyme